MKVTCQFCKHEWETKSKMVFVCCPSCLKKNKIGIIDNNAGA